MPSLEKTLVVLDVRLRYEPFREREQSEAVKHKRCLGC